MQAATKGLDSLKQQADCHLILPYQSLPYKEYLQKLARPLPFSSILLCCPVRNSCSHRCCFLLYTSCSKGPIKLALTDVLQQETGPSVHTAYATLLPASVHIVLHSLYGIPLGLRPMPAAHGKCGFA